LIVFRLLSEFSSKAGSKRSRGAVSQRTSTVEETTNESTTASKPYVQAKRNSAGIIFIALGALILVTMPAWAPHTNNPGSDSFYSFIGMVSGLFFIGLGILNLAIGGVQLAINQAKNRKRGN
jgi:hypothetical protein